MGRYKDYREPKRRGYNDDYTDLLPHVSLMSKSPLENNHANAG